MVNFEALAILRLPTKIFKGIRVCLSSVIGPSWHTRHWFYSQSHRKGQWGATLSLPAACYHPVPRETIPYSLGEPCLPSLPLQKAAAEKKVLRLLSILLSQPPKTWTGFLLFETDLYIVHGWMCQVSLVLHWFYALEICVQGKHVLCRGMGALLKETDLKPLPGYL